MSTPIVKDRVLEERDYQLNMFEEVRDQNSLLVLPTGLGKTAVAVYLIADVLKEGGKVLFLAPTKPLCDQHRDFILKTTDLEEKEVVLVTGESLRPKEREEVWKGDHLVYTATPQTVNNDLHKIPLDEVKLIIFDEVHRAVGDYAYVEIAKCCKNRAQFLGMTASPGSSFEKLVEVCYNLRVEGISVRSESDEDVSPYTSQRSLEWIEVEKGENVKELEELLNQMLQDVLNELGRYTKQARHASAENIGKSALLDIQKNLKGRLARGKKGYLFHALSLAASSIKISHLRDLLATQGVDMAYSYVLRLMEDDTRAAKYIKDKSAFQELNDRLIDLKAMPIERNPKLVKVRDILDQRLNSGRAILFTQYRDTVNYLVDKLTTIEGIKPVPFIGQADRANEEGMSQDEQQDVINAFREGEHNVLVSTSIGEEGIDVPATNLVIFYEPVPSAIRSIQRKGRTGRDSFPGHVVILIMEDTKDQAFYWKSKHGEKGMMKHVYELDRKLERADEPLQLLESLRNKYLVEQSTLESYS